jgi:hypothetical protein
MKHLYYAAELIETAGLGEVGVNLFVGTIPADVTEGVMLRDPLVGAELDEGLNGFTQLEFNVIVRSADPAAGYDKALAISRVLRCGQVVRPDLFVLRMAPCTLPVSYPKGDADDIETSVRILIGFKLL